MAVTMFHGSERRRYPRAAIQLPLQLYAVGADRRLAEGVTVNVSPVGLLAECTLIAGELHGELVDVRVGLPLLASGEEDERFRARVLRVEEGGVVRCAVEVLGTPPASLLAPELLGSHSSIVDVKRQMLSVLNYDVNVLIRGDSGTGKNVVAALIHRYSRRSSGPFIRVSCPSIPDTLLESQLFGHEKGAFTDARQSRPGLFRIAHGGTIVLDEISAVAPFVQAKLLQAIEEKRFMPIGSREAVHVDVRILATTNDDLEKKMREGSFRRDLFYRLNEIELMLPPLRNRKTDIPLLADYFLRKCSAEFEKDYRPLGGSTLRLLQDYGWPGNVRELENTIKRGVLTGQFDMIAQLNAARQSEEHPARPERSRGAPMEGQSMAEVTEEA
jgi:transcriptional regulator with PAS, ATPase and Fis domain